MRNRPRTEVSRDLSVGVEEQLNSPMSYVLLSLLPGSYPNASVRPEI